MDGWMNGSNKIDGWLEKKHGWFEKMDGWMDRKKWIVQWKIYIINNMWMVG